MRIHCIVVLRRYHLVWLCRIMVDDEVLLLFFVFIVLYSVRFKWFILVVGSSIWLLFFFKDNGDWSPGIIHCWRNSVLRLWILNFLVLFKLDAVAVFVERVSFLPWSLFLYLVKLLIVKILRILPLSTFFIIWYHQIQPRVRAYNNWLGFFQIVNYLSVIH